MYTVHKKTSSMIPSKIVLKIPTFIHHTTFEIRNHFYSCKSCRRNKIASRVGKQAARQPNNIVIESPIY